MSLLQIAQTKASSNSVGTHNVETSTLSKVPAQGTSSLYTAVSNKPGFSNVTARQTKAAVKSSSITAVADNSEFDEDTPFEYESSVVTRESKTAVNPAPVVVHGRLRARLPF